MQTITNFMKLSDSTLAVLKNFAGINNSILVKKGNQLRTISVAKNILAEAEIPEDFPRDVAIYDLNQFLNGLSLHQDPNLDFTEDSHITIKEGKRRVKYFYADPQVIIAHQIRRLIYQLKKYVFNLKVIHLKNLSKQQQFINYLTYLL